MPYPGKRELRRYPGDEGRLARGLGFGHPLMATQFISRVREGFQIELSLRRIFEEPTVAGLAAAILEDVGGRARVERAADLILRVARLSDDEVETMLDQTLRRPEERSLE